MLHDEAGVPADDVAAPGNAAARRSHAMFGPTLARLCAAVEKGDVLAILSSEQRGEAAARAAATLTDARVLWFPPSDALPGEAAPPSPAVAGRRYAALAALQEEGRGKLLLITDATAAASYMAPPEAYRADPLVLAPGDAVDPDALAARLEAFGYFADDRVDEAGEYALRGGAIDVYPADADLPIRLHIKEGRVETISLYDPISQIGQGDPLAGVALRPAREPEGFPAAATLFDHLPGAAMALDPESFERRDSFIELAREGGARAREYVAARQWDAALAKRARIELGEGEERPSPRLVELKRPDRAFVRAIAEARDAGDRVVVAGSERDLRFIIRRLEKNGEAPPRRVTLWRDIQSASPGEFVALAAELERGWREPGLTVVAAGDLLGSRARVLGAATAAVNPLEGEAAQFHAGDAVIHEDHGLGLLRGLETIRAGDSEGDAFRVEYAGGGQRLVPVEEGAKIWRYGAEPDVVTLDRLDGSSWEKRRQDINMTLAATARDLIALARQREESTAPVLEAPTAPYEKFVAGFPYSETPDQLRAVEAVQSDLLAGKPMDRLVVGDVGYGKTEVALRAAAVAAIAGKQVAVVAPTTVLVRQHLAEFRRRMGRIGIEVAGLSRLSSAADAKAAKQGLADGRVKVVVGTRMLAGKTIAFADLGLVIIDEEQRFGAADKVKLRALSEGVHVLTLTATPIPRTLQTALVGLQDLSLIATPPARRLPTRTIVAPFAPDAVKAALLRERRRGGQSFVVVPRIDDMEPMAERLRALVPALSVRQAHGKMPAAEIDDAMVAFAAGDGDVLLATNIIEAGLDIPRANTMLILRSDMFGLAQLHQLRGRVGRGRVRGFLMLTTEAEAEIAPATLKRLRTLEALDQLGAGFAISARDLDLRGAGELLGEEQAGHMKLIGVGLYQHLLEQAIRTARGENADSWQPELNLGVGGRIPEAWVPEEDVRVNLYVRIARLAHQADAAALAVELEDRFGTLPEEAMRLLAIAEIRRLARDAMIARVDAGSAAIALTPRMGAEIDAPALKLEKKDGRLLLRRASEADVGRLEAVRDLLEAIAG
ncbi:MAG TPA: helicase-related protein [Allosphingosinicella sp.]|nr:helicase-related protein [Allosphingosinicella sp.]